MTDVSTNGHAKVQKDASFGEIGRAGLNTWSGIVNEEFLVDLRGDRARKAFREMSDNDPVVGSILFAVDMLMRQVDWSVDPVDESEEAADAAQFVSECLDDMSASWDDTLSSVMSFLIYGWSYHEILYKRRVGPTEEDPKKKSQFTDGKVGWRKFDIRAQETLYKWELDDSGGIQGMWQQAPPDYEPVLIPIEKALLFRTTAQKNNPEGKSMLRNAYRPWYFKQRIEEIEAIGVERDLAGLPVAWVPPTMLSEAASSDEKAALDAIKKMVASIKRDEQEGIVFPLAYDDKGQKRYDLTLLSTGGQRQFNTDAVISRYDQRIAMVAMADFVLLGHENVGSFALGASKMDMFSVALGAWLDMVASVLNQHALPRLFEVNDMDPDMLPTIVHEDVERIELTELAAYLGALSGAGMPLFPDPTLEEHLREVANLPEPDTSAVGQLGQAMPPPRMGLPPMPPPAPQAPPAPMARPAPPAAMPGARPAPPVR